MPKKELSWMKGWKAYVAGLGLLLYGIYLALYNGQFDPQVVVSLLTGLGIIGIRHAQD